MRHGKRFTVSSSFNTIELSIYCPKIEFKVLSNYQINPAHYEIHYFPLPMVNMKGRKRRDGGWVQDSNKRRL